MAKPQPVPPDKGPSPPIETPPDTPNVPEDPGSPPKGDPPVREPERLDDGELAPRLQGT